MFVVVDNTDGATACAEANPLLPNAEVTCSPNVLIAAVIFVVAGPGSTIVGRWGVMCDKGGF